MDDFVARQMSVLRHAISDYREDRISLDTLVQRIEGVSGVIGLDDWKEAVFPIIVEIEQVNAMTLDLKTDLTLEDRAIIEASLRKLEALIQNTIGSN